MSWWREEAKKPVLLVVLGAAAGWTLSRWLLSRHPCRPSSGSLLHVRPAPGSLAVAPAPTTPVPRPVTSEDVLGPFFVVGSPFRGKLSPPGAAGQPFVLSGRVVDAATGRPLPYTPIDIWQASPEDDAYDFYWADESLKAVYHPRDDPKIIRGETGGRSREYSFRTCVMTDHTGRYEVESVVPPPYFDPDDVCECTGECLCAWRCPHLHFFVQPSARFAPLITQMYFDGGAYNQTDKHFTAETMVRLAPAERRGFSYSTATFDIALKRASPSS